MIYNIAIIGSRGDLQYEKYTHEDYENMMNACFNYINHQVEKKNHEIRLVSGGCSFSDHLVVSLYNKAKLENNPFHSLIIYSPCKWDKVNRKYKKESSNYQAIQLNKLHATFSSRLSINSLEEINELLVSDENFILDQSSTGYIARNHKIAQVATILIAFGWMKTIEDTKGGTKNTWEAARNCEEKVYYCIKDLRKE